MFGKNFLTVGRIVTQGLLNECKKENQLLLIKRWYAQQGSKRLSTRYTYERMISVRWEGEKSLSEIAEYLEKQAKELKEIGELEKQQLVECESVGMEGKIMLSTEQEEVAKKHQFLRGVWDVVETVSSAGKVLYEDWSSEPTDKQIYSQQKQEWVKYDEFSLDEVEGGVLDLDNIMTEEEEEELEKQSRAT
eukprot:TRINITY_DN5490_c0_g2_i1.p2 TRINITY_DN5490_c0_g2~~TRINITY_DN5490_c0_g2_i1.p2  ORF type:complete len:191 (-),score=49.87 TRINITY_DN5490_c0_g2_i1:118-690(-)